MSRFLPIRGVPVAVPIASSHDCQRPLWNEASRRITPGALSPPLFVFMFPVGGRS
jgi:hypothetical protein